MTGPIRPTPAIRRARHADGTAGTGDAPAMPARRRWLALAPGAALAAVASPWATGGARAQPALPPFPARPLSLVVPYTAGGASDIGARMLNVEMARLLEQPVVIDNVGGAAGALGVQKLLRAPADGHTLLYGSLSETLLVPLINPRVGYAADALLPVAFAGGTPAVFVTRPDFPAATMDAFIALARRQPGRLSYASPGIGSFQHVVGEAFKQRAGVFMVHIAYRGGAQILADVMSGQVDLGITSAVNAAGQVAAGRLKAIGVTAAGPLAAAPGAQPFGAVDALRGLDLSTWGVVFVRAGTPAPLVTRLNEAVNAALMLPANAALRQRLGAELPAPMDPARAQAFVRAERAKYEPILAQIRFE